MESPRHASSSFKQKKRNSISGVRSRPLQRKGAAPHSTRLRVVCAGVALGGGAPLGGAVWRAGGVVADGLLPARVREFFQVEELLMASGWRTRAAASLEGCGPRWKT